jgi:spore maturation protein SpmA
MKQKPSVMNVIWLFLIMSSLAAAAFTGRMEEMSKATFDSAKNAVTLAIGLIGIMALWLGVMKVAEAGGLMQVLGRWLRPVMVRLFPDVPAEHPAMSAMIMNFAANILGLGNAATPLGIKAMQELDTLNPEKGTATNAMCYFLAINTSGLAIFPLGVMAIRSSAGCLDPAAIFLPTILTTACSTGAAILIGWFLYRRSKDGQSRVPAVAPVAKDASASEAATIAAPELVKPGRVGAYIFAALIGVLIAGFGLELQRSIASREALSAFGQQFLSFWFVAIFMATLLLFGYYRGVKVYEVMVDGAKDGFSTATRIIPYLVAILVGIGMFRASGAFDVFVMVVQPLTTLIGMPPDVLPVALLRPLSGTGAFGVTVELVNRFPNDFVGYLASTMYGGFDTTFYILAIYFGAVGIQKVRWALPLGLIADVVGVLAAVGICRVLWHG